MFGFGDAQDAHQEIYNDDGTPQGGNEPHFTHELLGGAAAFEAMRKYQNYEQENGKPESHEMAKDILAGFAGAEADRLVETKGEDAWDRERVKKHAEENAQQYYDQQYNN